MRLDLNATQAKKASKKLAAVSGRKLSECQQALAKAAGYRDWHDLEGTPRPVDGHSRLETEAALTVKLSIALGAPKGDVLHVLSASRIVGTKGPDFASALALRARVFELSEPLVYSDTPIGKLRKSYLGETPADHAPA